MRVISGSFKGKKFFEPRDKNTRPLKDLTKESIFNIIKHSNKFSVQLNNSNVLDLFSGVGSFGIECLSRGVKSVFFVENYKKVLPVLKKNLGNLKTVKNFYILEKDVYNENTLLSLNNKFDLIFLDPPYKDKNLTQIFNTINQAKILNDNGLIILHRHKSTNDVFPSNFEVMEIKTYGISKIIFISSLSQ